MLRGSIDPSGRLPSERELGRRFQVQRNTIRQALAVLEREGHISTQDRRGSFILPQDEQTLGGTFIVNIHRGSAPNLTALVEGITQVAEPGGFKVVRRSTNPLSDSTMIRVPEPESLPAGTAGLVLWPHYPTDVEKIRRLNERVPVVLVDQRVMGISTDCVHFDDVTGGKIVTRHLMELGHRRIAFLADEVFAETVQGRWLGYALAFEEARIPRDPKLSLLYQLMDAQIFAMTMRHLLSHPDSRPTAVVCSNDLVAFGLLRFLHAEGLRVPEDIAVTGYGNSMPDYTAAISLTTMDQPFFEAGREAARLLCERAHQTREERLASPQDVVLPVSLVVRGSTEA